ncbi:hypothetical protein EJ02DRAFT_459301, partial [Clathrospora elynae]
CYAVAADNLNALKRPQGTASQPVIVDNAPGWTSTVFLQTSPRKALVEAASQATKDAPFESLVCNSTVGHGTYRQCN